MNQLVNFMALVFGVRTAHNSEGNYPEHGNWARLFFPALKLFTLLIAGALVLFVGFSLLTDGYVKERNTAQKLTKLSALVQRHKVPPHTLSDLIGNDPMVRTLTIDSWGNPIVYTLEQGGRAFTLVSAGKDGAFQTSDDLVERISLPTMAL